MHGIDRRLELMRTGLVAAKAPAHDRLALMDQGPIPSGAVLFAEQHEGAIAPRSRRAPGFGVEQQRQQACHLGLVGHEPGQDACQTDRLHTEIFSGSGFGFGRVAQPGVAVQVDNCQHSCRWDCAKLMPVSTSNAPAWGWASQHGDAEETLSRREQYLADLTLIQGQSGGAAGSERIGYGQAPDELGPLVDHARQEQAERGAAFATHGQQDGHQEFPGFTGERR